MSARAEGSDPRRGAVLLMVLVLGLVASSVTVVALRASSAGVRSATVFVDEMRAEALGQAATDLVAAAVASGRPDAARAGAFRSRFADGEAIVEYRAETARVDLNLAAPELMTTLFEAAGAEPRVARELADRVVDWRDPDSAKRPSGAERDDYRAAGRSGPANRPFSHMAEVEGVLGMGRGLLARLAPAVTVASGSARVDPILADPLVVLALMGGDRRRTEDFLALRRQPFARMEDVTAPFPNASRAFIGLDGGKAVRAAIRIVLRDGFERRYEAVVGGAEAGAGPSVLAWESVK
ncbi:general secretion pathway protein GspK [Prosthecomicrobium sp. N25]|uniref:general secretion pathway protein GspK n=1 Tax=Prosthecomicrobium sp. N25 TaxID=3129254 RepID=UPI003076C3C5